MVDPRWPMVRNPSLTMNVVTMTSLLFLKIVNVFPNFLVLLDTLQYTI